MIKVVFAFALLLPVVAHAQILSGTAKNKKGEIVYLEKHEIERDPTGLNKMIRVTYSKPDGSVFATMTSDFSKSKILPETVFEDKRFGAKAIVRLQNEKVEFEEVSMKKKTSRSSTDFKDTMVLGQGFDNFIRINSLKLASEPLEFKFGVLDKRDFYTLTGYKKSLTVNEVEYGIRASNWLVRLFADELSVVYDIKTMQLKSFVGRSNILDDNGKAQDVAINYEWIENP